MEVAFLSRNYHTIIGDIKGCQSDIIYYKHLYWR